MSERNPGLVRNRGQSINSANQADMEAASSSVKAVTPAIAQHHPSAAKFWVDFAGSVTINSSYNVTSITDNDVGDYTVNIATDFSSADFCAVGFANAPNNGSNICFIAFNAQAAGTVSVLITASGAGGGGNADATSVFVVGYGDQ